MQLRQSYLRIAKRAAMMAGRYAHAKQFNRHRRELRILRTRLAASSAIFDAGSWARPSSKLLLSCASQIRSQQQRQRGWKLYSFHAPEVECVGKGKASAPYEFGVKASMSPPTPAHPAASSCSMPSHCRATLTTATP